MMTSKRQVDSAARVGGEEFALLLPESDVDGAFTVSERLRERVRDVFAEEDFPALGTGQMGTPLTVSLGVASFPLDGTSSAELLGAADLALYEAKRRGRDQTVTRTMIDAT
jgi:diguanylate cyclase (GGDEF)-like protein